VDKKIIFFILFIVVAISASIAITIQYDIYSYHIWAYTAIKEGVNEIYNINKYFDRVCDYPPLGAYISIFQGKVLSFFSPLKIGSIPMLFFYKLLPLLFIFILFYKSFFHSGSKRILFSYLLCTPFAVSTVLNGQFDIIIVFLILMSIVQMEKKNQKTGIVLLVLALFVKQTAFFFVFLIFLHYFIEDGHKKKFLLKSLIAGLTAFLIFFAPFIIKGNIVSSIKDLIANTLYSSPFSGYAFNILSLIKNSKYIDFNYNVLNISFLSYSLLAVVAAAILISIKKEWDILKKMALFSIVWFNFLVGLREQHILYPFFFLSIYLYYSKKNILWIAVLSVLSILNFILYNPLIALAVFKEPTLPDTMLIIFTLIQVALSSILFIIALKEKKHTRKENAGISFSKRESIRMIIFLLFIILFAEFAPGFHSKEEKEFFSHAILKKNIIEISNDKYIDLNVISLSSFENYLGLRMADNAYFKAENKGDYQELIFDAKCEFIEKGALIINNDTILIENTVENISLPFLTGDTLVFKSVSDKKYSQIALYNFRFK
jgi:hypothetical protein